MSKIDNTKEDLKIGIMTVTLPSEQSTNPTTVYDKAKELARRAQVALVGRGVHVIHIEKHAQSEKESVSTMKKLLDEKVDYVLLLIGSWMYVNVVATPARMFKKPFAIWAFPDMEAAGLVPASIIQGGLDELGLEGHTKVYGWPEDKEMIEEILTLARAAKVRNRMDGMMYGLLGGRCMFMYTGMPDLIQVKDIFGVETDHVDQIVLVEKAKAVNGNKVKSFLAEFKDRFGLTDLEPQVLDRSIRLYFALKELWLEKGWDFCGLKCLPELPQLYSSGCLAVSFLNNEKMVTACEADTNGALTMKILSIIAETPVGFADCYHIDKKDKSAVVANCGMLPTNFAINDKDVDWALQYEYLGKGRGTTTVFVCKPGRITMARLARVKGEYVMQIVTGEADYRPKNQMITTRTIWPQMFCKIDGDPEEMIRNCRSNHYHWAYGDWKEELLEVCRLFHIKPLVV